MENIEEALASHGLIADSNQAYKHGLMRLASTILLYKRYSPNMPPVNLILSRYNLKASQLPEPTEKDITHAWSKTNGQSRNIDEWLTLVSDPVEAQAPNLTCEAGENDHTTQTPQKAETPASDERGKPSEALEAVRLARCDEFGNKIGGKFKNGCDKCKTICACELPSDPKLAFFKAQPDQEFDKYYCGCHGWD